MLCHTQATNLVLVIQIGTPLTTLKHEVEDETRKLDADGNMTINFEEFKDWIGLRLTNKQEEVADQFPDSRLEEETKKESCGNSTIIIGV